MSTYDNDVVYTLNQIEQPESRHVAVKQVDVAKLLHTYTGGEASWAIFNVDPAACPRCMGLARQIMLADGSWSDG